MYKRIYRMQWLMNLVGFFFKLWDQTGQSLQPVASGHGKVRPLGRVGGGSMQIMTGPYLHWLHRVVFQRMAGSTKEAQWVCFMSDLWGNEAEWGEPSTPQTKRKNCGATSWSGSGHYKKAAWIKGIAPAFHTCTKRLFGHHSHIPV